LPKPDPTIAMTHLHSQDVIETYRRYAPVYDKLFGAVLEPGRDALGHAVRRASPRKLLEVGVGTGLTLERYPAQTHVYGVDISEPMLALARERAAALMREDDVRRIELAAMNAESLDFPDDSFDCVTLPYVLSATPQPARLVEEIRRVCRPDGDILILNHFSGSRFWWLMERSVKSIAAKTGFRSDFRFEDHILSHGWHVEDVRSVNLFGLSKLVAIRNIGNTRNTGNAVA
jgi:phosphatidylethanolamine/phosphatidyl-N-methylethanolamine N-methyltransferase